MTETLQVEEEQKETVKKPELSLQLDRIKFLSEQLRDAVPQVKELQEATKQLEEEIGQELMHLAFSMRMRKDVDRDALEAFKRRPFAFTPIPGREGWYYVLIPRFIDMQIGWLDKQDESYNYFVVNRWVDMIGELPEILRKELGIKPPLDVDYSGGFIRGDPSAITDFARKYPSLISSRRGNKLVPRPKRHFEVLAALLKEGFRTFNKQPVSKEILIERKCDIELRSYQKEAWKALLEWSNIGLFYPANVGKSLFGVWLATRIKPPTLVVVPTILLKETWEERIQLHTDLKMGEEIQVLTYQSAIKRYGDKRTKFNLKIYDETHHLPANELSRLATIPSEVSIGLTASPQREDKREEYIFALTGKPIGLGWEYFRKLNLIRNPTCHVWIVKNMEAKVKEIGDLAGEKRTIVFCDSIELGTIVSKRYGIPHVHGATKKDRLSTIQNAELVVVSRVGDEGISLPNVEQIIEISWLGRSRRQELQRFTRLLHSRVGQEEAKLREPIYHILMTPEEYARDRKRLFSVMDKGFKVQIHREGVSERTMERARVASPHPASSYHHKPVPETITQPPAATIVSDLPGMQKLYETLTEPQQRLIKHLSARDGEWHSTGKLWPFLGYTTYQGMINSTKLPELEHRKIIERKSGQIRTNFRGLKE